jgi:hypothetical protein
MATTTTNLDQVLRQTDYTEEMALAKLAALDNDVVKVVREYLTGSATKASNTSQKISVNQQIYKEIRTMMDDASMTYEKSKGNMGQ